MYTLLAVRRYIDEYMKLARSYAEKAASANLVDDAFWCCEYTESCRVAVKQARLWHARVLAEYGIVSKDAWLNAATVPPVKE